MESFRQFHPLFLEAINDGKLGVCQWLEAGTTIDTAVPELYGLINDKEEWRAVIVRMEDELDEQPHPTKPNNPYDFIENASAENCVCENPVPLVRLTQMLGGVPAPQVRFEAKLIQEENKESRLIYLPVVREEEQAAYRELSAKYQLQAAAPTEIILVSLRNVQDTRVENVQKVWDLHKETNSSEFWKRNGYPSICRFTFYEIERKGPIQKTADLFKAWTAVMLLALNEIDPNTMQAYKLHRLDVDFDKEEMGAVMQRSSGRAVGARHYIKKSIQREIEQKLLQEATLPDYRLDVPVVLNLPQQGNFLASPSAFKLTASTHASDMERWKKMRENAEAGVRTINTCAKRALDQTADTMRQFCHFSESDVYPLGPYQIEDFDNELDALSHKIFDLRSELPCDEDADMSKMEALSKKVWEKLQKRVTTRYAILIYAVTALLYILSLAPAMICYMRYGWGSWKGVLLTALFGIVLFGLAELIMLFIQNMELRREVRNFSSFVSRVIDRISKSANMFSNYMSGIASHVHGRSYLSLLQRKRFLRDEEQTNKQNHLIALNLFVMDLKKWSVAFHLPVDFDAIEVSESLVVDTELPPRMNPLYTFETKASYSVPVNSTGDAIEAPFSYIRRLHIKREEMYDDA